MFSKNLYIVAVLAVVAFFSSCGDDAPSTEPIVANKKESSFELTALQEREKSLSYDEYLKIKEKYDKLKKEYEEDNSKYDNLLKLAEIYIYEARVSGEHPYYYTAALETLDELLNNSERLTDDQRFTTLFYKSTVQLSQHNFNKALSTGSQALSINDLNSGIYGVLVDANVEIGNYEEAVKRCESMMQIRPDLRSYSRTSYLREIYGDVSGSKAAMVRAIKAGAPYSEYKCWALVTLGKLYEDHGSLDSALICYDIATDERENYPFGVAGKARVQAKRGDLQAAEKTYKEALAMLPEIGFNIELAELKLKAGDKTTVDEMVAEIETMFKEDIESGHNMNIEFAHFLYTFKGDYKKALELGLEEYKNRPNNIDVNKLLAFIYYGMEDMGNAQKHAEIALRTGKKDADLMCINGLIKEDKTIIKQSFDVNPYQGHNFVDKAKTYL